MKLAKLLREKKQKLRDKVPLLDLAQVRRCRIPFHEALLMELQEGQFERSHKFFAELIQDDLGKPKAVLTNDKTMMETIFDELKTAEGSTKERKVEILVKLAGSFEKIFWIADKIYAHAIAMVNSYNLEMTRSDSTSLYFYGKFLSANKDRLKQAVLYLKGAFEISYGVEEWTITDESNGEKHQLYVLIANDLCESLLNLSKANRIQDGQESLELAKKSLRITRKTKSNKTSHLEVEALIEIGNCYMSLEEIEKALTRYQYAFDLAEYRGVRKIAFEALMKMSDCYKESNMEKYEEMLTRAKGFADQHSLMNLIDEVLVKLGKMSIKKGRPNEALIYLEESAKIFKQSEQWKKLQEVQLLMGPLIGKAGYLNKATFSN